MSPYCMFTDAAKLIPKATYDATSQPNSTQFASYVVGISADMDARMLAVGITVPVSTSPVTDISRHLQFICMNGAAAVAEIAAFSGGNKMVSTHGQVLMDYYQKAMGHIEANPGIIATGVGIVLDSYEFSNVDKRRDADEEPFRDGKDDW